MATESNTPADATTTPATTTEEYDPALLESVKKQVEYYFSKENLSQDPFLQSQMDAQMSVPISVIMKFSKMKHLTSDENVVRRALQDSSVTIVNNRIKANIKASTRSTIILRDVPADTTEEEIREVFNYEGARPIVSLRSDIGGTWFVNFEGEEDAKTSLLDLRMKKRTLKGESVKARIKTEQVVRSFFPVNVVPPPAPIIGIPPGGFPGVPFLPPNPEMMPFGYVVPPIDPTMLMESFALAAGANLAAGAAPADASVDGTATSPATAAASDKKTATGKTTTTTSSTASGARKTGGASSSTASSSTNNGRSGKDGKASSASTSSNNRNNNSSSNSNSKNSSSANARHSKSETGAASASASSSSSAAPGSAAAMLKQPAVELNNVNFPPLFNASEDALHNTPIPQVGYPASEEYVKYTIDDVIMIVKSNVQDATLPAEVNASAHPLAMQSEVNLDLLKRQRTFTIDETREQLRQGRPVTSGLLFESVDYRSLHYGDSDSNPTTTMPSQSNHAATASFQQQLSTIEEAKNETSMLLNMSMDSVLAHDLSQMDMSFSMETQSHTMQSPARMNASSWAAMVKSAADVAANVHLVPATVTITTTTTTTITTSTTGQQQQQPANNSKKTSSNNASNNNNNEKKKKSNNAAGSSSSVNEKKNEKKASGNDKSNKNNNNASSSANKQGGGRSKNNSSSANHAEDKQQEDGEHAAAGATAAWGGKSSFASVLKTKAEEDAAAAAAAAPATTSTSNTTRRPATSTSATKPTSSNNNNASSQRNNNNNNKKQSNSNNNNIQESGGMWAKETLPPLKK